MMLRNKKLMVIVMACLWLMVACTPTATVEYDPDTAVPLSLVEDLQFSDTSSLSISDCQERFTSIVDPVTVKDGDVVPADFVLYIDLDPVYVSWEKFPMDALCVKANWGLFRTKGLVEIPTDGQIWSIDQDA